ncbi:hypothetical protein EVAR_52875_1 [Eumeta japonica]|uniref:Uncharacterized protein n=1 Tax=Eumeta variegata TaxID=151549 RepID=A0A4C1YM90_EUMVA|nr:hypothetical protein EVAR_52875_1 [Eumeta japonica]
MSEARPARPRRGAGVMRELSNTLHVRVAAPLSKKFGRNQEAAFYYIMNASFHAENKGKSFYYSEQTVLIYTLRTLDLAPCGSAKKVILHFWCIFMHLPDEAAGHPAYIFIYSNDTARTATLDKAKSVIIKVADLQTVAKPGQFNYASSLSREFANKRVRSQRSCTIKFYQRRNSGGRPSPPPRNRISYSH